MDARQRLASATIGSRGWLSKSSALLICRGRLVGTPLAKQSCLVCEASPSNVKVKPDIGVSVYVH